MSESLSFTASIAPLQSAIRIASDGGARVAFDIPESEMPAIVRLVLYRAQTIKVTIETLTEVDVAITEKPKRSPAQVDKRRAAKR